MRNAIVTVSVVVLCLVMWSGSPASAVVRTSGQLDINGVAPVDAADIQLCINIVLQVPAEGDADVNEDGHVNATDIQLVINYVLGINPDSDGDGVSDFDEVGYDGDPGYNPYPAGGDLNAENDDTDGDGVSDKQELDGDTDPLNPDDLPADTDGDGLYDYEETQFGTAIDNPDSDGDGLTDGDEVMTYGTDPMNADSDDDGIDDGAEVNDTGTNPASADTDGDELPDKWEIDNLLDPTSDQGDDGASGDPDGDTLTNIQEYQGGTDPNEYDGAPPEDFSGTWTGTWAGTDSNVYPSDKMPHGYVIAEVAQTGANITVTFPVGTGSLTGRADGDTVALTGTLWTGESATATLTVATDHMTGTYMSQGTAGNINEGDLDLTLTQGPPASLQTGKWYGTVEQIWNTSDESNESVLFMTIRTPSVSTIEVDIELEEAPDPTDKATVSGVRAGNVFMILIDSPEEMVWLSGRIESNNHLIGTALWEDKYPDDDFGWAEFDQLLAPPAPADFNGTWRVSAKTIYADDPSSVGETIKLDFPIVQTGSQLVMNNDDMGLHLTGEARGDSFALVGYGVDADDPQDTYPIRIDGTRDGSHISGTWNIDDVDWQWGTYTGSLR